MLIGASALCYQLLCKSCLHLVIVLKFVVTKNLYQCEKHMIMASFQIRAVCGMFKDFPTAVMQELLSRCDTVWPNIVMQKQNTCAKQSREFMFNERS